MVRGGSSDSDMDKEIEFKWHQETPELSWQQKTSNHSDVTRSDQAQELPVSQRNTSAQDTSSQRENVHNPCNHTETNENTIKNRLKEEKKMIQKAF